MLDTTGTWNKSPAKTTSGIVFQQSELAPTIVDIGLGQSDGMDGTRLFKSFDCVFQEAPRQRELVSELTKRTLCRIHPNKAKQQNGPLQKQMPLPWEKMAC
jgi:hypothetical protein